MWTHTSRSDDIIVLLNGEKYNPITFESQLSEHPDISGALVFGTQRSESGVLLELHEKKKLSTQERALVIKKLWPTMEKANRDCPAYAQVSQSHVLLADPHEPFQRTGKEHYPAKSDLETVCSEDQQFV